MSRLFLPFRSFLFTFSSIVDIRCVAAGKPDRLHTETHVLIAVTQGCGSAIIDGRRHRVVKGSCFLLPPHTLIAVGADDDSPLRIYVLSFHAVPAAQTAMERSDPAEVAELSFTPHGELNAKPFGRFAGMLDELYRDRSPQDELEEFKQHVRLQELLYELYRGNSSSNDQVQSREAVRRSIDSLHRLDVTVSSVDALARQANIGIRQYTHLFKQLTGQSPLDYITELRLNEAKKQLLVSNESLQQIALSAGFKDVYYFSRRFKQMVGQSPKQYVRHTRLRLRVVALYYANVLLSIGVKPIGANLTWWGGSLFLREMEKDIVDIGSAPTLESVSRLEPDLIIMNDINDADYASLSKIAPTFMLPYEGRRSIYEDARLIGELINKPKAADELQSRFERRAAAARERLTGIVNRQDTAVIVRFEREGRRFSVFGDNYGRGGWPIYRGLQLSIPETVQRQAIDSGLQIIQDLPLENLPMYAGSADYLFVVNEGEGIQHVENSAIWQSLPAVEHGRVHVLDSETFSYFDPISIEGQLDLIAQLLAERNPAS
jgi:iron complex transport system substrate-binding protein